jgi:uncharacterized membrane protein required for colicin V production
MGKMPFNWFDVVLLALLVVGIYRGRKRGMSHEVMPLLKWLTLVLVCGFCYEPVAGQISSLFSCSPWSAFFGAYVSLAVVVTVIFGVLNRSLGGKVIGSDVFGKGEYYLGVFSGLVRYACVILFGLALLNSPLYTTADYEKHNRYMQQNYDHDFFPTLFQVQDQVFKESLVGPMIAKNLDFLLIKPASTDAAPLRRKQLEVPM